MVYSYDTAALMRWSGDRMLAPLGIGVERINHMIAAGEADGVVLDPSRGSAKNLDAIILGIPKARIVSVIDLPDFDNRLTSIAPSIEELALSHAKYPVDVDCLPNLRGLSLNWHKSGIRGDVSKSKIETLNITNYKSKTSDLANFPHFKELKKLYLIRSNIKNLSGISRFHNIAKLALHYNSKLENLDCLCLPALIWFLIEQSHKISDYSPLRHCKQLERLTIINSGSFCSLSFTTELPRLRSLRFIKTPVMNSDLSPLLRLEDVYFTQKKGYSHKLSDFRQSADAVDNNF